TISITGNAGSPGDVIYFYLITNPGASQTVTLLGSSTSEASGINLTPGQVSFSADIPNITAPNTYQIEAVNSANTSMGGSFTLTTASSTFAMPLTTFGGTGNRAALSQTLTASQIPLAAQPDPPALPVQRERLEQPAQRERPEPPARLEPPALQDQ